MPAPIELAGDDVTDARRGERLRALRRRIQLVYQNPFASLDPRQQIVDIVAEPLQNFRARLARGAPRRAPSR